MQATLSGRHPIEHGPGIGTIDECLESFKLNLFQVTTTRTQLWAKMVAVVGIGFAVLTKIKGDGRLCSIQNMTAHLSGAVVHYSRRKASYVSMHYTFWRRRKWWIFPSILYWVDGLWASGMRHYLQLKLLWLGTTKLSSLNMLQVPRRSLRSWNITVDWRSKWAHDFGPLEFKS